MNPLIEQIYATRQVEDEQGNPVNPFPSAVPIETGQLLYDLVRKEALQRTLELGMGYGLSTQFICQAHRDRGGAGSHIAIDPWQHQRYRSIGLKNLRTSGLDSYVQFHHAESNQVLPRLRDQGVRLDFAFIDGMHAFDHVLLDFFFVDQMLEVGRYMVFDDLWLPGVRKALGFILRNRAYELIHYPRSRTVSLWKAAMMSGRRLLQNRFLPDASGTTFLRGNACVLKKLADETRNYLNYRRF